MARFYRTLVGPAIVGVSVWCATGSVAVLSSAGTERVVASSPWWVAVLAVLAASLVPEWRRRPATALPALVSTLPWWPVPLPAMALVWTGPLAWMPIAAALCVAIGSRPIVWLRRATGAENPQRATKLAAAASAVVAIAAAWAADPRVPGGDEPHYLVITQSLIKDADLRIENNHAARDYASYFGGTIRPDYLVRGRNGEIYSIHAPGVSAVVLPAFALLGFRGAQATIILLFAIAGALIWRAAWRSTGDVSSAWFAWAALAGSTTMAVLSFMIFPETPGACAVAAGVWLLVSLHDASRRSIIAVSTALASLPWMHSRFSVLAGVIGVAIVSMMLTDRARPMVERKRRVLTFLAIPAVSALAWLSMFYVLYGTWDPRAPYGPNPDTRPWIWGAVTGIFVDQQFGLLAYAPVLSVALAGCVIAAWPHRISSALPVGMLLVYAMAVCTYWMWWAGVPGLPARFLTAALPLLSVPLAVAWTRSTAAGRKVLITLLLLSLGITVVVLAVDRSVMAWNFRDGQAAWLEWLSPVVNLPRAWPSFFWRGERAFLAHSGIFMLCSLAAGLVIWWMARSIADAVGARLAVALTTLMALMLMVEAGWSFTGGSRLDPARAQLMVHARAGSGARVWHLGHGIRRWRPDAMPMRIQPDQPPLVDRPSPAVLTLVNVPAGIYHLQTSGDGSAGSLAIRVGRSEPLQRLQLISQQPQSFPIVLPAGAFVLVAEADSPELAGRINAALVPASAADPSMGYARQHRRYSDVDVFFRDGNAFPEAEGFWVGGARTTAFVLSQGPSAATRVGLLTVRNGASDNTVTIQSGEWKEVLVMKGGESRVVPLPLANAMGAWPLTITSSAGFRPSDTAGEDNRFLGLWVSLSR